MVLYIQIPELLAPVGGGVAYQIDPHPRLLPRIPASAPTLRRRGFELPLLFPFVDLKPGAGKESSNPCSVITRLTALRAMPKYHLAPFFRTDAGKLVLVLAVASWVTILHVLLTARSEPR